MEELKLGQIITTKQDRDAIHIAVFPALAGEDLQPGQHVGFDDDGWRVTASPADPRACIGVVDPFLKAPVKKRETFWLFLYPNTITGLRHDWSHPAIAADGRGVASYSEKWLRDFAVSVDAEYYEMMHVAETHCEDADGSWPSYLMEGGKWEGQQTPAEFWVHFQNVTGKKAKVSEYDGKTYTPGIFSCSC